MALADITLNDGQASPVAHTFTYITTENGRVVRKEMAQSAETPWLHTIAHKKSKINGVNVDSHLERFDFTFLDADGVTPRYINIRVCADVDPLIYTDARAKDAAAFVRNRFAEAVGIAFMKGSVG